MAKILVLDDVFDAVNLVRRVLEAAGHEVFGFTDEKEALGFIKKNPVDLAILDIKLKKRTLRVIHFTTKLMLSKMVTDQTFPETQKFLIWKV